MIRRIAGGALVTLLLVVWSAPSAAHAQDPAAGTAPEPVPTTSVTVGFQSPAVASDGDFSMLLTIDGAPPGSDLAVRIYERIEDASALLSSADGTPDDLRDTFDPIQLAQEPTAARSQPGAFTINLYGPGQDRPPGAWAYRLADAGVYPIEVRVRDEDGEVLTSIVTYLVREPDADDPHPTTPVALIASVHADPAMSHAARISPTRIDPAFVRRLSPVLSTFADRPRAPASFAVTPDNAVQLAGDTDPDARALLTQLRDELGRPGRELLGSPYVRIDPASLVENGLSAEIERQAVLGVRSLATSLQDPVSDTWYLDRRLDDPSIQAMRRVGVTRLVVPSANLDDPPQGLATLTRRGTGVTAAPVTPGFDLDAPAGGDPRLAGYQLLGRLAAVSSFGAPDATLIVRLDALTVDPVTLGVVLDGMADPSSYLRPVPVSRMFDTMPADLEPTRPRRADPADLGSYPATSDATHQVVASYGSMVPDQPELVLAFERPMAISASADLPLRRRERDLTRIQIEIRGRFAKISAPERDTVTLGARDATFPFVIRSDLDHPVQVVLQLQASDRLEFPDDRIEATVQGERTPVEIKVHTRGSGDTPLLVTTRTPDGRVVLTQTRYTVRSTAVSGVGVLLTIGAGLFLAIWWGRHWWRHRSHARHGRRRVGPRSTTM